MGLSGSGMGFPDLEAASDTAHLKARSSSLVVGVTAFERVPLTERTADAVLRVRRDRVQAIALLHSILRESVTPEREI